ncbi:MAG: hypothetical protein JWN60_2624 [Acidobacteria bacterium]|jgi:hypothetical protein|nr:hypothetical protein [Acidobacteriota bacterium]
MLFYWLLYLNIPSLFIVEFIVVPVLLLLGRNLLAEILGYLVLIFCITFQWMFIGYLLKLFFDKFKTEDLKISLN